MLLDSSLSHLQAVYLFAQDELAQLPCFLPCSAQSLPTGASSAMLY